MATPSYVKALLGPADAVLRVTLGNIFEYVLRNLRIGPPEAGITSENFSGAFVSSTTPSTGGTEFSITHGLASTPYVALSVLPVGTVGVRTVPLEVTRAADGTRIYLKTDSTAAAIRLYVE